MITSFNLALSVIIETLRRLRAACCLAGLSYEQAVVNVATEEWDRQLGTEDEERLRTAYCGGEVAREKRGQTLRCLGEEGHQCYLQ